VKEDWLFVVEDAGRSGFGMVRMLAYVVEQFMVVGVFQAASVCFCDWGPQGREDDYVVRLFLEDLLGSSLDEAGHVSGVFQKCVEVSSR